MDSRANARNIKVININNARVRGPIIPNVYNKEECDAHCLFTSSCFEFSYNSNSKQCRLRTWRNSIDPDTYDKKEEDYPSETGTKVYEGSRPRTCKTCRDGSGSDFTTGKCVECEKQTYGQRSDFDSDIIPRRYEWVEEQTYTPSDSPYRETAYCKHLQWLPEHTTWKIVEDQNQCLDECVQAFENDPTKYSLNGNAEEGGSHFIMRVYGRWDGNIYHRGKGEPHYESITQYNKFECACVKDGCTERIDPFEMNYYGDPYTYDSTNDIVCALVGAFGARPYQVDCTKNDWPCANIASNPTLPFRPYVK